MFHFRGGGVFSYAQVTTYSKANVPLQGEAGFSPMRKSQPILRQVFQDGMCDDGFAKVGHRTQYPDSIERTT